MKKVLHVLWSWCALNTLLVVQETFALRLKTSGGAGSDDRHETEGGGDVSTIGINTVLNEQEHLLVTERGQEVWNNPDGIMYTLRENSYWVLRQKIGEGSFGKVYKAVRVAKKERTYDMPDDVASSPPRTTACDTILKRFSEFEPRGDVIVFKVVKFGRREGEPDDTKEKRRRVEIQREIEILEALNNHPNVVKIHDHQIDDAKKKAYLVMDSAGKRNLWELIAESIAEKRIPFSVDEIRDIMGQIFRGLEYLHQQGIAHRDIKLENVMVTEVPDEHQGVLEGSTEGTMRKRSAHKPRRVIKLIDFGLSKKKEESLLTTCGTLEYAPPEILRNKRGVPYTEKCDIWSAGVLMFTLLYHTLPFHTDINDSKADVIRKIKDGSFTFPPRCRAGGSSENEHVDPEAAKQLIRDLLTRDPEHRPSATKVLQHEFFTTAGDKPIAEKNDDDEAFPRKLQRTCRFRWGSLFGCLTSKSRQPSSPSRTTKGPCQVS